jgi:hypothetical protein
VQLFCLSFHLRGLLFHFLRLAVQLIVGHFELRGLLLQRQPGVPRVRKGLFQMATCLVQRLGKSRRASRRVPRGFRAEECRRCHPLTREDGAEHRQQRSKPFDIGCRARRPGEHKRQIGAVRVSDDADRGAGGAVRELTLQLTLRSAALEEGVPRSSVRHRLRKPRCREKDVDFFVAHEHQQMFTTERSGQSVACCSASPRNGKRRCELQRNHEIRHDRDKSSFSPADASRERRRRPPCSCETR